ncbi:hypothetical protein [Streptomyces sp. NBC_01304]|uniref:hypothetical protein n=1 Tax=Streptomyces sp. NBC_01304 TaxID=2903818 RepID=UPI002E0FC1BD|nr:hypothetical protein OG430_44810 [Streptomyces sp. NBC_01304]
MATALESQVIEYWEGPLGRVDRNSADGRRLAAQSTLDARPLPVPLYWQEKAAPGHDGAIAIGLIDHLEYREASDGSGDTVVWGAGRYDPMDAQAQAVASKVERGYLGWASLDLDPSAFEIDEDEDGQLVEVFTGWKVAGATLVGHPAFAEGDRIRSRRPTDDDQDEDQDDDGARGDTDDDNDGDDSDDSKDKPRVASKNPRPKKKTAASATHALIAAASPRTPVAPPKAWFDDPQLTEPTGITVTDDGRVFGHLADWRRAHVSNGRYAPRSSSGYQFFHLGSVLTEEGDTLPVGTICLDTPHADIPLSAHRASAHYADTGNAVAIVRAGEDAHGIWLAGALTPEADEQMAAKLRRSPLSGDWREVGGHTELIAALATNNPAIKIPRQRAYAYGTSQRLTTFISTAWRPAPTTTATVDTKALAAELLEEMDALAARRHTAATLAAQVRQTEAAWQKARVDAALKLGGNL